MTRECGDCTVCCTFLSVKDLTIYGQPCKHECGGCTVYGTDERPKVCAQFKCLWLAGAVGRDERDRPDQSGLLFYLPEDTDARHVCANVVDEQAAASWQGDRLLSSVERKLPVVVAYADGRRKVLHRGYVTKRWLGTPFDKMEPAPSAKSSP